MRGPRAPVALPYPLTHAPHQTTPNPDLCAKRSRSSKGSACIPQSSSSHLVASFLSPEDTSRCLRAFARVPCAMASGQGLRCVREIIATIASSQSRRGRTGPPLGRGGTNLGEGGGALGEERGTTPTVCETTNQPHQSSCCFPGRGGTGRKSELELESFRSGSAGASTVLCC